LIYSVLILITSTKKEMRVLVRQTGIPSYLDHCGAAFPLAPGGLTVKINRIATEVKATVRPRALATFVRPERQKLQKDAHSGTFCFILPAGSDSSAVPSPLQVPIPVGLNFPTPGIRANRK
jgi:hypothetical protein